ncbi:hypothetical protein ACIBD9_14405 [Micromonospora sp. NPDC050784]|uniref:hypothetical protein n=1 Tax=Micromonospora sp. NPDC050784 TaxID=3364281 RepID=UPI003797DFE2
MRSRAAEEPDGTRDAAALPPGCRPEELLPTSTIEVDGVRIAVFSWWAALIGLELIMLVARGVWRVFTGASDRFAVTFLTMTAFVIVAVSVGIVTAHRRWLPWVMLTMATIVLLVLAIVVIPAG